MSDFPYDTQDVATLLNIPICQRKEYRGNCPFCGNSKDFCLNIVNGKFICHSCGVSGRGPTRLYSEVYKIDTKEAHAQIMNLLNLGESAPDIQPRKKKVLPVKEHPIANSDKLDSIYNVLLDELKLNKKHYADLLCRGFNADTIKALRYRSYPYTEEGFCPEYESIPRNIAKKLGKWNFDGVPGFYVSRNERWNLAKRKRGILVPYINREKKLVGMQIRKDRSLLDEKESKYSWLSSNDMYQGTKSTGFLHFACDFEKNTQGFYSPVIKEQRVRNGVITPLIMTEGAMKGDLLHEMTGYQVIATSGAGVLEDYEANLSFLKRLGFSHIINCYDMDYLTNEKVQKSEGRAAEMARDHGFMYERKTWNQNIPGSTKLLKGIDDYYAYHMKGIIPK